MLDKPSTKANHQAGQDLARCPACGQQLRERAGVRVTAREAAIFDVIARADRRGVLPEVLAAVFYPDKPHSDAKKLIAVHIHNINDKLEETDRIIAPARGAEPYRLVRRLVAEI